MIPSFMINACNEMTNEELVSMTKTLSMVLEKINASHFLIFDLTVYNTQGVKIRCPLSPCLEHEYKDSGLGNNRLCMHCGERWNDK